MNWVYEYLREQDRSLTWLAKRVKMLPQTLGNKLRGLSDEQIEHTCSVDEMRSIVQTLGHDVCPLCKQPLTKGETHENI